MARPWKAHLGMALLQLLIGGYHVISKVALNAGVNQLVFSLYRDLIALIILAPLAFFREKTLRPPMTPRFLLVFCFLGFTGIFGTQLLLLAGLAYTNPSYMAALLPSIPVFTFVFAVITGADTLNLRKSEGRTKLLGTLVCISGAILMVAFRGPAVFGHSEPNSGQPVKAGLSAFGIDKWLLGTLCIIGCCICYAIYTVAQAPVLKKYPASISVTAYSVFFGVSFLLATALVVPSKPTDWHFSKSEAFAACYGGFVASALNFGISAWSNKMLGPTLVGIYSSLLPATTAILSNIFLGSPMYLGSIAGGALILAGLYLVIWATYLERRMNDVSMTEPLLNRDLSSKCG